MKDDETEGTGSIGGTDFDFLESNVQAGRVPSHIWIAVPADNDEIDMCPAEYLAAADSDRSILALVGLDAVLRHFLRHANARLPFSVMKFPKLTYGAIVVGIWPASRVEAVLLDISGRGGNTAYKSALMFHRHQYDGDREPLETLSPDLARLLIAMFLDQCFRAHH